MSVSKSWCVWEGRGSYTCMCVCVIRTLHNYYYQCVFSDSLNSHWQILGFIANKHTEICEWILGMYTEFCYNSSCIFVRPHFIENCVIKVRKKEIWPVIQHFISKNSQYTYTEVCVIQTLFTYSAVALQPVCVKKTCIIAELTVPWYNMTFWNQLKMPSFLQMVSAYGYKLTVLQLRNLLLL
jgi:hypothetical protein